jgi:hypothetical protein
MDPKEISSTAKAAFQKFPAITALGFAMAGLQTTIYDPHERIIIEQIENELSVIHGD